MLSQIKRIALTALSLLLLTGCVESIQNEYSTNRAFFRFSPVTAVPPLYRALTNPGLYCHIDFSNKTGNTNRTANFIATTGESQSYALTSEYANRYIECISGFIVGMPSIPDVAGNFYLVAYDLVCPTCYDKNAIQRSLDFGPNETAVCGRCNRTYSLIHGGIISGGEGSKLKRYRITYDSNILVIQN